MSDSAVHDDNPAARWSAMANAYDQAMLAAIERSQAVVEFNLQGRVLHANENFLRSFGYTAEEVLGIHHSIFVDPAYAISDEYRAFWARLNRGEFIADKFCRVAKDGSEVWIQATYNPILGEDGAPKKIVKFATDITPQELFARDARGQLEAISRSQAVVEFSLDGTILTANENFCRMMGYTLDELRGRRHSMLVDKDHAQSASYRSFWGALGRGEFQAAKYLRVAKGGRLVWIQAAYNPALGADGRPVKIVKFATDITDHERFARDARGQLDAISKSQAVIEFMTDGTILSANENFCRILGYTREEIRARHHSILVPPEISQSEAYQDFWPSLARGEFQAAKYRRIAKDGGDVWIQASYNPIFDDTGRVVKVVKYATDITEQVRQEQESTKLRELNNALDEARIQAEQATRTKSQFLATMSHEVRTPMNGVLGMLEVAMSADLPPETRDQIITAHESASSLLRILNDILDYSKIEAGQLEIESLVFSPRQVVDEVASMLEAQVRQKRLKLKLSLAPSIPEWISGDPTRFRQILTNLVGNAIKFTDEGSIGITATFIGDAAGDRLRLEVTDTGIGMDEDTRQRLFVRFNQADASTTRRFGGTGLGLAICRELVNQMKGDIGVDSTPGEGSTFWFELPARAESEPENLNDSQPISLDDIKPARILVAEDNPVNQKVLRLYLKPYGHDLTFVENGAEAVDALENERFDLVLMDVSMPVMDGPSATRIIRGRAGPSSQTPIIALTANAMAGDRDIYLAAGMNDYLSKPVSTRKLVEMIERHRCYPSGRATPPPAATPARTSPEPVAPEPAKSANQVSLAEVAEELDAWIAAHSSKSVA